MTDLVPLCVKIIRNQKFEHEQEQMNRQTYQHGFVLKIIRVKQASFGLGFRTGATGYSRLGNKCPAFL